MTCLDRPGAPADCACPQKHIGYPGCCVYMVDGKGCCCCGVQPPTPTIETLAERLDRIESLLTSTSPQEKE